MRSLSDIAIDIERVRAVIKSLMNNIKLIEREKEIRVGLLGEFAGATVMWIGIELYGSRVSIRERLG